MKLNRISNVPLLTLLGILGASILGGCGPKDADPKAKVDAPGYYNGDMKPHGQNAAGNAATGDAK